MQRLVLGLMWVGLLVGCGGDPDCETCPDVAGEWTMVVENFSIPPDQSCSWYEQLNEVSLFIEQPTPGGPQVIFSYALHRLAGSISTKNVFIVQDQTQEVRQSLVYDRTDVLSGPFNAEGTGFEGTLSVTLTERGSAEVCTASATVRGIKR